MATSVSKRLSLAHKAILNGDKELATKTLLLTTKRGSPSPKERVTISEYWSWIGDDSRALKVLGPLKSPLELASLNQESLLVELRKAYILGMAGARYLGLYLFEEISSLIQAPLKDFYPQIFQNKGYLYLSAGDFDKAIFSFKEAICLYKPDQHQHFFISLGLHDALLAQGKLKEAAGILDELEKGLEQKDSEFMAIFHQVRGENLHYQNNLNEALEHLLKSLELFSDAHNKDHAYAHKHLGITYLKMGEKEKALSELNSALTILSQNLATPMAIQEVYFWLQQVDRESLSHKQQISLYAHPSFGMLSASLRGQKDLNEAFWMTPFKPNQRLSGLMINGQSIVPIDYKELKNHRTKGIHLLDLRSSIFWEKSPQILDETTAYCLMALMGAAELGVTESLLFDFVFRSQFSTFESAQDRLKKAIKKIKTMGFQIERKKSVYFYHGHKQEIETYLPFEKDLTGPHNHIREFFPGGFNTNDLKKSLGIPMRKAQRMSKDWLDSGIAQKSDDKNKLKIV